MDPEPPKASRAPKSPYALARRSLKWHRGLVAASGVALLLVPLSTPLATYLGFEGDSYRRLVGTAALASLLVSAGLLLSFRCPHCGKSFHRTGVTWNPFARSCRSCGQWLG